MLSLLYRIIKSLSKLEGLVEVLKARVLDEPVLVGREHELVELQMSLNSAMVGKGTTVFVSGEA
jgi:hypothetical protein